MYEGMLRAREYHTPEQHIHNNCVDQTFEYFMYTV